MTANTLGNPFDTGIAVTNLVFGGVMDRFPRLNVVLPHAGGVVPYLAGRLQHGQAVRGSTGNEGHGAAAVHGYFRRFHYDTIVPRPEAAAVPRRPRAALTG